MSDDHLPTPLPTAIPEVAVRKPRKKELKNLTRREGIWYFHKRVNGKKEFNGRTTPFSLETRDLIVAKAKRDAILRAANGAEVDRVLGRERQSFVKLDAIFEAYRRSPMLRASVPTREANLASLERMVCAVRGPDCRVGELSSTELTWQLVENWQAIRLSAARQACAANLAAFEAAKRAMNSTLAQVQSVFSTQARAAYRALHLPPNIADFATALPVPARKQEDPVHLADEFVMGLLAAAPELQTSDPGAWAAFQLMTWGGLRNRECFYARRDWLEQIPAGYRLSMKPTADFLPKGNSREVILPANIVEAIFAQMRDDHLVPGATKSDRHDACYRRLNQWLKRNGVTAEVGKVGYRLRKFFLKKVAVQQHPFIAQAAGGHSSFQTTQDHYIGKPKMASPIKLSAAG